MNWRENWLNLAIVALIGVVGFLFSQKLTGLDGQIQTTQTRLGENKTVVDDNNKRIKDLEKQAEDIHTDVKDLREDFDKISRGLRP